MAMPSSTLVLYDGSCGFCTRSADFGRRHARAGEVAFAPLQSDAGRAALAAYGFPADYAKSVVVIENGRAYTESTATLRLAAHLRWPWRVLAGGRLVPRAWRDAAYQWVAVNRGRLPGATCALPTPEAKG